MTKPVALMLLFLATPAAAKLPQADVEAFCLEVAWTGTHTSTAILDDCRRWERESQLRLDPLWHTLPAQTRDHCRHLTSSNGTGSTRALDMCVRVATLR